MRLARAIAVAVAMTGCSRSNPSGPPVAPWNAKPAPGYVVIDEKRESGPGIERWWMQINYADLPDRQTVEDDLRACYAFMKARVDEGSGVSDNKLIAIELRETNDASSNVLCKCYVRASFELPEEPEIEWTE